jgi:arsenate reductase
VKFYTYNKCSTCRKAKKFLEENDISFKEIDLIEDPPSKAVLKKALNGRELRKLFNTSGVQYRELKIKDKLKEMTESQALDLLAGNGKLIKRPIAINGGTVTVGFDEGEYKNVWIS